MNLLRPLLRLGCFLSSVLLLCCFAGCGGGGGSSSPEPSSTPSTPVQPPAPAFAVSCPVAPWFVTGSAIEVQRTVVSNAVGVVTFSIAGGSLPDGLALGADGSVSGTPSTPGVFRYTIGAKTASQSATVSVTATVEDSEPLTLAYDVPPFILDSSSASATPVVDGVTPGVDSVYTITNGQLPTGLRLETDGSLAGMPSATGSTVVTIQISNGTRRTAAIVPILVVSSPPGMIELQPGNLLWKRDPASDPLPGNRLANITWLNPGPDGKSCVQVVLPATSTASHYIASTPFDITPYRGMQIRFECLIKTEGVTQPDLAWKGVVCELGMSSALVNYPHTSLSNTWGTYDWKTFSCGLNVPIDATDAKLYLGLQGCTGKAWIADWQIRLVRDNPARPAIDPAWKPERSPKRRGVMLSGTVFDVTTADRFDVLQSWNVNLVRWIIGYNSDTAADPDVYDTWLEQRLNELEKALAQADAHGLRLIVDLHVVPGGRRANGSNAVFYNAELQRRYIAAWTKIATRFKSHPAIYAFDLMNEPSQSGFVPDGLLDWRNLQIKAAQTIRAIDPVTAIAFEVDGYDAPANFQWLKTVNVSNVIYSVHMYFPMEFTHQGVSADWGVAGGVTYPGTLNGQPLDKAALRAHLQPVRDFQLANKVRIVVGEFSAIRWAPGAARYLADVSSLFEEYDWDWCYHAFREWPGWSLEAANLPVPANINDHIPVANTDRMDVIRGWFDQDAAGP